MKTILKFTTIIDGKTYEGNVTVPDDNGTTTLPMLVHGLMTCLSDSHPEVQTGKVIQLSAVLIDSEKEDAR